MAAFANLFSDVAALRHLVEAALGVFSVLVLIRFGSSFEFHSMNGKRREEKTPSLKPQTITYEDSLRKSLSVQEQAIAQ